MMKRLLLSAAAAVAVGFGASADTLDMLPTLGSGGWESSYDAATHTITYDGAWKGRGWWFGEGADAANFSAYDEMVVEFEAVDFSVQLVVEYDGSASSSTNAVEAGKTKVVTTLDETAKAAVKQIYIQNSAVGSLTVTAAYMQNSAVVDPSVPVELISEPQTLSGWNNFKITAGDFAAAKLTAGDQLVLDYTAESGNGFKVCEPTDGWPTMPFIKALDNYNAEYGTIYLDDTKNTIAFNLDAENVALMLANGAIFQGDKIVVNKVLVLHKEAQAGIADVAADENAPVEYFNLQGVRIAEPAAGQIVIRRQGTKVQKMYVK